MSLANQQGEWLKGREAGIWEERRTSRRMAEQTWAMTANLLEGYDLPEGAQRTLRNLHRLSCDELDRTDENQPRPRPTRAAEAPGEAGAQRATTRPDGKAVEPPSR